MPGRGAAVVQSWASFPSSHTTLSSPARPPHAGEEVGRGVGEGRMCVGPAAAAAAAAAAAGATHDKIRSNRRTATDRTPARGRSTPSMAHPQTYA
eukprot:scaffold527_cov368-Prasinococcus_capsulatus_cf.AAC.23